MKLELIKCIWEGEIQSVSFGEDGAGDQFVKVEFKNALAKPIYIRQVRQCGELVVDED